MKRENSKTQPLLNSNLTGKRGYEKKIEQWRKIKNKKKTHCRCLLQTTHRQGW
jgi:hypothetical protein